MSNLMLRAIVLATLALQFAALFLAVAPRLRATPLLVGNLGFAAIALAQLLVGQRSLVRPDADWPLLGAAAFELVVLGLAVAGLRGVAAARTFAAPLFAVHLLASCAAAAFVLTFRMTRLI